MNPLSAMGIAANPQLKALSQTQGPAEPPLPKNIPFSEAERINPNIGPQPLEQPNGPAATSSFDQVLGNMVQEVNEKQNVAGDALKGVLAGDNVSLHQAMVAMEEASVSFQLMVEVRNKLLESYQELMRMQI